MGLPGFIQYLAEDNVSCSKKKHNSSDEARTFCGSDQYCQPAKGFEHPKAQPAVA